MPISTLQSGSFPSNVAIDTDTLVVDGANNLVGVGTSAPSGAKLEIFTASTAVDGLKINRFGSGVYYSTLRQDSHGLAIRVGDGSTIAERVAITPNGLTFNGDTAAATALDDYEEGTWTPASGGGTGPTGSGSYIKIGRSVTVMADVTFTGITSPTYQITGLPFQANDVQAGACIAWNNSSRYLSLLAPPTTSVLNAYDQQGSIQNINNNNRIIFSVTYQS